MTEFMYQEGRVSGAIYTDERKEHKQLLTKVDFSSYHIVRLEV